jgi:hypothetical protein
MRNFVFLLSLVCCVQRAVIYSYHVWPLSKSISKKPSLATGFKFCSSVTRIPLQLVPGVDFIDETVQIGAGARSSLNCEVDYLGMINFCLRSSDNGLSGPSTNKLMNEITNDAFRVLMMGYGPGVGLTVLGLATSKEQLKSVAGSETALTYLTWLEDLLTNGDVQDLSALGADSVIAVDSPYVKGYKRLLDLLKDAGCKSYGNGLGCPKPEDTNICLSLLDLSRPAGTESRTLELNTISNCVSKVALITCLCISFRVWRHLKYIYPVGDKP